MEKSNSPKPVLPRLDRLDRLLQILEEKHHSLSGRNLSGRPDHDHPHSGAALIRRIEKEDDDDDDDDDDHCKTISSALEEVHHKGTLIERLTLLENRVLQLSLDMDEGNSSKSSSSTMEVSVKSGHVSGSSSVTKQDKDEKGNLLGKEAPLLIQEGQSTQLSVTKMQENSKLRGKQKIKRKAHRKWLGWFRMGC